MPFGLHIRIMNLFGCCDVRSCPCIPHLKYSCSAIAMLMHTENAMANIHMRSTIFFTHHWPHSNCRTVRHPKSHFPVVDAGRLRTEHMDMTISILPLDFPFIHIVGSIGHIRWPTKLSGEHIIFVLFVQRDAASVCERSQFCIYVYSEELLLSCRGLKEWVECFWRRQWRRWPLRIILIYALQNNWVHEYLCVCAMLDFCSSIR